MIEQQIRAQTSVLYEQQVEEIRKEFALKSTLKFRGFRIRPTKRTTRFLYFLSLLLVRSHSIVWVALRILKLFDSVESFQRLTEPLSQSFRLRFVQEMIRTLTNSKKVRTLTCVCDQRNVLFEHHKPTQLTVWDKHLDSQMSRPFQDDDYELYFDYLKMVSEKCSSEIDRCSTLKLRWTVKIVRIDYFQF